MLQFVFESIFLSSNVNGNSIEYSGIKYVVDCSV